MRRAECKAGKESGGGRVCASRNWEKGRRHTYSPDLNGLRCSRLRGGTQIGTKREKKRKIEERKGKRRTQDVFFSSRGGGGEEEEAGKVVKVGR